MIGLGGEFAFDPVAQLMHAGVAGVDDHVGLGLEHLERGSFGLDRLDKRQGRVPRMRAFGALVAAHQHRCTRLQEDDAYSSIFGLAECSDCGRDLCDIFFAAA